MSGSTYDWLLVEPVASTGATATPNTAAGDVVGLDIACINDIDSSLSLCYDANTLLLQSIARRLITPRGSLCYNPDYGFDLRGYLNAGLTTRQVASLEGEIQAECEKDERVSSADVTVRATAAAMTMAVKIELETVYGNTALTLLVSGVTVEILRGES
jgi:phage baseplate assembly protein W